MAISYHIVDMKANKITKKRVADFDRLLMILNKKPLPRCAGEGLLFAFYWIPLKSKPSSQAPAASHTPRRHFSSKGLSSPAFFRRSVKVRLPPWRA